MSAQFRDDLPPEVYPLAWLVGEWRGQGTLGYGPIKPGRIRQEVRFQPADGPYLAYQARTWLFGDQTDNAADAAASPPGIPAGTASGAAATAAPGSPSSTAPARSSGTTRSTASGSPSGAALGATPSAAPSMQSGTAPAAAPGTTSGPAPSANPAGAPSPPSTRPPVDQPGPPDPGSRPGALWHQEAGFWRVTPGQGQIDPPFEIEVLISDAAGYQSLYLGQIDGPRIDLATDAVIRTASAPEVNAATRMYGLVAGDLLWAWDVAGFGHRLGSYMAARLRRAAA